ncbi:MAG: hypothetical protein NY202_05780 [Mollicutes bacterium UO1]
MCDSDLVDHQYLDKVEGTYFLIENESLMTEPQGEKLSLNLSDSDQLRNVMKKFPYRGQQNLVFNSQDSDLSFENKEDSKDLKLIGKFEGIGDVPGEVTKLIIEDITLDEAKR